MDQNDIFKISKFAIFFVLWLSNRITSGGPRYRETCPIHSFSLSVFTYHLGLIYIPMNSNFYC